MDGRTVPLDSTTQRTLLEVLRAAGFTAPKGACGRGECGACTVLEGGRSVLSCTRLAGLVSEEITTAAGLVGVADDLRAAFADHAAFQCGFCTPGQIVRAEAVLRENPGRGRAEIARAMAGNICRCTGYVQIVDAVCQVAADRSATGAGG